MSVEIKLDDQDPTLVALHNISQACISGIEYREEAERFLAALADSEGDQQILKQKASMWLETIFVAHEKAQHVVECSETVLASVLDEDERAAFTTSFNETWEETLLAWKEVELKI